MKRRIIAFLTCVCMILSLCGGIVTAATVDTTAPECSCDHESSDLSVHADDCARKAYCREVSDYTEQDLYEVWGRFPTDVREFILTYLSWTNWSKYQSLSELVDGFVEEPEEPEVPEVPEDFEMEESGCTCDTESAYGSLDHEKECSYHFANLTVEEEYSIYLTLSQEERDAAFLTLNTEKWSALEAYIEAHPFVQTVSEDGVSIVASDVPSNATITAEIVSQELTEALLPSITLANQVDFSLDIKVYDENGNEWQPETGKEVMVKVSLPEVRTGDKTDFIHIMDSVSLIQKGLEDGRVKLLDISHLYKEANGEKDTIQVTQELPDAYLKSLAATEELGYSKHIAYEIITGTCIDDGYSVFYTDSFSPFSNTALGTGTYYINSPSQGNYDEIGTVTIPAGSYVNLIFAAGNVPVSGTITVNGTLNVSLLNGSYTATDNTIYRKNGNTGELIRLNASGTLNVSGISENYPFIIDGKNIVTAGNPAIRLLNSANLSYVTIVNCKNTAGTSNSYYGGALIVYGAKTQTLSNVNIKNCSATAGGAIAQPLTNSVLNLVMSNVTIEDCFSIQSGGGMFLFGGTDVKMTDVTVKNCYSQNNDAGGIASFGVDNVYMNRVNLINCSSASYAGGIYFYGNNESREQTVELLNVQIDGCKSNHGSGVAFGDYFKGTFVAENCEFKNCQIKGETLGGTIRTSGKTRGDITLKKCKIFDNSSHLNGGGIYWNAGGDSKMTIEDCDIYGNTATNGGGIYCESLMEIKGETKIRENTATNGGGIFMTAYTGDVIGVNGCELILTDTIQIKNNTASSNGGGVLMNIKESKVLPANAVFKIQLNGAEITSNTAGNSGGGLYMLRNEEGTENYQCTLDLNYGEISGNTALKDNGGGVYVSDVGITMGDEKNVLTISGNKAINGIGGAVYATGTDGECSISNGTITGNDAKHGGAIGVSNGIVNVDGGALDGNTASSYGGAIYATGIESSINVSGDGRISSNSAANGGGIYATAGGAVNVSGGIISNNAASGNPGVTTAYDDAAASGVGGGIYVGNGTGSKKSSITISGESVGVYNNTASFAAADAYASGNNTVMSLPNVEGMDLTGYNGTATGWFEDYATSDASYNLGFAGGSKGERYKDADTPIAVESSNNITKYAAITLGKLVKGDLTIEKTGTNIDEDQTFVFEITKPSDKDFHMTVSVKGTGSVTIYDLVEGTYNVEELKSWSWRYKPTEANLTAVLSENNVKPKVTFNNTRNNNDWLSAVYRVINVKGQ